MLHPHTELRHINDSIGLGVFATSDIPKGTVTWALDPLDQVFTLQEAKTLWPRLKDTLEKYTYRNNRGDRILCWDFARFMNHSCEANTFSPGLEFEIAVRDIKKGEQITSDYGALNIERMFRCCCGSPRCRRSIRPDDFKRYAPQWDEQLRAAFLDVFGVDQPLLSWITEIDILRACAKDVTKLPSIIEHLYEPRRNGRAVSASQAVGA